jgi:hypothetical protein
MFSEFVAFFFIDEVFPIALYDPRKPLDPGLKDNQEDFCPNCPENHPSGVF